MVVIGIILNLLNLIIIIVNFLLTPSNRTIFEFKNKEEKHTQRIFFNLLGLLFSLISSILVSKFYFLLGIFYLFLLLVSILRYLAMKHLSKKVKTEYTLFGYEIFSEYLGSDYGTYKPFKYYVSVKDKEDLENLLRKAYARMTMFDDKNLPKEVLETMIYVCLSEDGMDRYQYMTDFEEGKNLSFQLKNNNERSIYNIVFNINDTHERRTFGINFVEKDESGKFILSNFVDVTLFLAWYQVDN